MSVQPSSSATSITQSTETILVELGAVSSPGPAGPPGPPGPQGPTGASGTGSQVVYTHIQAMLSQDWYVEHNMGRRPTIQAEDSAGHFIIGSLTHLSDNALTIHFAVPMTGKVNCT